MIFIVGLLVLVCAILLRFLMKPAQSRVPRSITGRMSSHLSPGIRSQIQNQIQLGLQLQKLGKLDSVRQGLIEIDKGLQLALKDLVPDRQFVDQMRATTAKFPNKELADKLWSGHKVRNLLVHEVNIDLPTEQVARTVREYAEALEQFIKEY